MRKVGIWIDLKEAHIITLSEGSIYSKTIYSDVETRIRNEGEKKQFGRFGDQYLVDEKGIKNRIKEFTHRYLISILKELKSADEIMLFGPAQTKGKLEKVILNDPEVAVKLKAVKVSENMTHNQKIAFVKDYYKIP
jgi:hypothetical protein